MREKGLATVPEVGRTIVQEQVARGGTVLPWIDQPSFMEEVLRRNIQDHQAASRSQAPVIFDRGVPECLAWARILGLGVQPHHRAAVKAFRYHPLVFLAEPWPEIYVTDIERRDSFADATASYQPTVAAFLEAGRVGREDRLGEIDANGQNGVSSVPSPTPRRTMPKLLQIILIAGLGFLVAAVLGYVLVNLLSSNQHDRSVEAAMTALFVAGPLGAIVAGVVVFFRDRPQ